MALVVEDGSGVSGAEAYQSLAGFKTYADGRGWDYSAKSDAQIEAAIRQGSTYIDALYAERFTGSPATGYAQGLAWPRLNATDVYGNNIPSDELPARVTQAASEAAWVSLQSPGALNKTYTPGEQKVLTQVDKIRWEVVGDASKKGAMVPVLTSAEGILWPLLKYENEPVILVVS